MSTDKTMKAEEEKAVVPHPGLRWFRNKFITGLFVIIPVVLTVFILKLIYRLLSGVLDPLIRAFVRFTGDSLPPWMIVDGTIPGLALMLMLVLILVLGIFGSNVLGKRMVGWMDWVFMRIPLVNLIYPVFKQVVESIQTIGASRDQLAGRSVVYVPYPNLSGYLLGFQTGSFVDSRGRRMVSVFIPTAPNPITGFVLMFEADAVLTSELSMDAAWKLLVSAGFVVPKQAKIFPPEPGMPGPLP